MGPTSIYLSILIYCKRANELKIIYYYLKNFLPTLVDRWTSGTYETSVFHAAEFSTRRFFSPVKSLSARPYPHAPQRFLSLRWLRKATRRQPLSPRIAAPVRSLIQNNSPIAVRSHSPLSRFQRFLCVASAQSHRATDAARMRRGGGLVGLQRFPLHRRCCPMRRRMVSSMVPTGRRACARYICSLSR